MTGYGPPDDPSEAPTGYYDYSGDGDDGQLPPHPGSPWYRKPIVLLVLGLFAAILLGLAIYVVADRSKGRGGSTPTSTSPTTSTAVTPSTTTPTTEVPVVPAPTTTLTNPPTTGEPTTTAPTTTPPTSTSIDEGHHHHHHHAGGATP